MRVALSSSPAPSSTIDTQPSTPWAASTWRTLASTLAVTMATWWRAASAASMEATPGNSAGTVSSSACSSNMTSA